VIRTKHGQERKTCNYTFTREKLDLGPGKTVRVGDCWNKVYDPGQNPGETVPKIVKKKKTVGLKQSTKGARKLGLEVPQRGKKEERVTVPPIAPAWGPVQNICHYPRKDQMGTEKKRKIGGVGGESYLHWGGVATVRPGF